MRSRRNADGPGRADIVVDGLELQVVIEDLYAAVAPVADVDVALGVRGDRVRQVELPGRRAFRPGRLQKAPVLVILDHTRAAVPVGHEDIPGSVPRNVGRAAEDVRLRLRPGRNALDGLRTMPERHHNPARGVELDDQIAPLVHYP